MEERDPQLLWRRIGAGDRRAFTALYERYEDDVLRFCRALVRNGDDAREAANGTWAAVWRSRAAAQRGVELRPWLFRIAHNEAVDIIRRRRPYEQLDARLAGAADPAADAELHERLAWLRADLMALSDHQRTAVVLRELSGLSHEEIGAVLSISASAAKQAVYEGRRALLDAEGGRSLSCDLIRRDLATGDRRVLRGRRLRAHLRSCTACRELATAVADRRGGALVGEGEPRGGRGRELGGLVPAPLAALLSRLAPGAAVGGGGATAAVVGTRLGAPLLGKVAVGAVGLALGTQHGELHKPPRPAAPQVASAHEHAHALRVRAEGPAAKGPQVSRGGPTAVARTDGTAVHSTPAAVAARRSSESIAARGPAKQDAPSSAPAQVSKTDHSVTPPGRAKKPIDASPAATAPGQVKRQTGASPAAMAPGQVKKQTGASPAATAPGQVKRQTTAAPAPTPPGQAKRQAADSSDATPPAAAEAPAQTVTPAAAALPPGQANVPPGQAKKAG